jgi:hypothetical protein
MKGVYRKFYKMSRNEAFAAFAITFLTVAAYSLWGAYILQMESKAPSHVASVER